MVQQSANQTTFRRVMCAYTKGDLAPLMDIVTDDVVWDSNAQPSQFRFGGRYVG
jgi:hypothetical protein